MPGAATTRQHKLLNIRFAAYQSRVELPTPAKRYPQESRQRLGAGHSQVHLRMMSALGEQRRRDFRKNWSLKECLRRSQYLDSYTLRAVEGRFDFSEIGTGECQYTKCRQLNYDMALTYTRDLKKW